VVMDLGALEEDAFENEIFYEGSDAEVAEHFNSLPMREVSGFERYTYAFEHPQIWHFFIRGGLNWFLAIFASTLLVSYLNAKDT
jgi:hypothetical protein